jgi:hypothetical protein
MNCRRETAAEKKTRSGEKWSNVELIVPGQCMLTDSGVNFSQTWLGYIK